MKNNEVFAIGRFRLVGLVVQKIAVAISKSFWMNNHPVSLLASLPLPFTLPSLSAFPSSPPPVFNVNRVNTRNRVNFVCSTLVGSILWSAAIGSAWINWRKRIARKHDRTVNDASSTDLVDINAMVRQSLCGFTLLCALERCMGHVAGFNST